MQRIREGRRDPDDRPRPSNPTWIALLVLLAACAAAPPPRLDETRMWIPAPAVEPDAFAAGERLLAGFDPNDATAGIRRGDRALYGLRLWIGEETLTRLIRVRVLDPAANGGREVLTHVEVFDAAAALVHAVDVTVSRRTLTSKLAMMEFLRIIQHTEVLADLMWKVVKKPSLFSLLGGVRVSAGIWVDHTEPAPHALAPGSARRYPFTINVNRQVALRATVTCTEPVSPLAGCGGVLEIAGEAAGDASRRVLIRLLAARRPPP